MTLKPTNGIPWVFWTAPMTLPRLLWRNLLYHWRGNLAVLLGVAVGTAVLTGALLVGDSLRGSLRALALDQLGWVDQAMVTPRMFRDALARELPAGRAAPAILLQGSASVARAEGSPLRRATQVTILGVDERFWPAHVAPEDAESWIGREGVVLNPSLAGGDVALADVLRRRLTLADWGLKLVTPSDRAGALVKLLTPPDRPVDGILRFGNWNGRVPDELAKRAKDRVLTHRQIADYYRETHGYLSLESRQLFIEPAVERAIDAITRKYPKLRAAPTLVYLADTISDGAG